ncbi:MAG TPA: hypothetical protein VF765_33275 [Polyangiaceae bacterium]
MRILPLASLLALLSTPAVCASCAAGDSTPVVQDDASPEGGASDDAAGADEPTSDAPLLQPQPDAAVFVDAGAREASPEAASPEAAPPDDASTDVAMQDAAPTTLDLHDVTLFDNPPNLADWPVTTLITDVEFQYMGQDGVHVEFSKQNDPGSWPDVTPPGWTGSLQYTLGFVENIGGQWYGSAAIQFWRGLPASGGNVAQDTVSMGQCTAFGLGSTCQVAKNWYYDGRWGNLAGYQPATAEVIGVFVVAGNVRGVTDGSQSPVQERSNIVLVQMPDFNGAKYTF